MIVLPTRCCALQPSQQSGTPAIRFSSSIQVYLLISFSQLLTRPEHHQYADTAPSHSLRHSSVFSANIQLSSDQHRFAWIPSRRTGTSTRAWRDRDSLPVSSQSVQPSFPARPRIDIVRSQLFLFGIVTTLGGSHISARTSRTADWTLTLPRPRSGGILSPLRSSRPHLHQAASIRQLHRTRYAEYRDSHSTVRNRRGESWIVRISQFGQSSPLTCHADV